MITLPSLSNQPSRRVPISEAMQVAQQLQAQGDVAGAEKIYKLILEADPNHGDGIFYLGMILCQSKRFDEAFTLLKRAVKVHPNVFEFHYNLGLIYESNNHFAQALECYRRAVELEPSGNAHSNLAKNLTDSGQLTEAIEFAREAIKRLPHNQRAIPHNNLGSALTLRGELEQGLENYKLAIAIDVENAFMHSNYLLASNYVAHADLTSAFEEHKKFGDKFESFIAKLYENPLAAQAKKLQRARTDHKPRIGYVSPDFYGHAVGQFIEPILATHDKTKFELVCYSDNQYTDDSTVRMKTLVSNWRQVNAMNDEDLAHMIQTDGIDILVDLAGHTALNRMGVFIRKPAPIQVTWIGYPNTTGLSTMDYRITDALADPVGAADALHTEKLLRLPECFSCFQAPKKSPDVGPLPALHNGFITIGSFNNFAKITPHVMGVWIDIMNRVPGSRLLLKNRSLDNPRLKELILGELCKHGADAKRVELRSPSMTTFEHLNCYNMLDIALDSFPYNGTTTTCEALWMGVPVVTLAGRNHVSRVGVSQMTNLGLHELIARDTNDYVNIAVALANDVPRLTALRGGLRERLKNSPLMNVTRFTKNLEEAYQVIWKKYLSETSA
ncbi:MAG: tetratricopeptide repeat protein [Phycisphaerales bacterium]|nr:tetratricopeptide repeat protein [Phycisphaerales bacterium]